MTMPTKMLNTITELDVQAGLDLCEEQGLNALPVDRPFNCCFLRSGAPAWVAKLLAARLPHRQVLAPMVSARPINPDSGEFTHQRGASARRRWKMVTAFRREAVVAALGLHLKDPVQALHCGWESMVWWFYKLTPADGQGTPTAIRRCAAGMAEAAEE